MLLVERGLADTRELAKALIMAGHVLVEDKPITKAGEGVNARSDVRLRQPDHPFVGRGGLKLAGVLDPLDVSPSGLVCADIGASIGGFTHCLLLAGAKRVYALDVDSSQLAWSLRCDARVFPVEGNARYLEDDWLPEKVDMVTIDVSFISVIKILARMGELLKSGGWCLALVKPQFELGPGQVGKGGVVKDPDLHAESIQRVSAAVADMSLIQRRTCPSPITGKQGNREFFVLFEKI